MFYAIVFTHYAIVLNLLLIRKNRPILNNYYVDYVRISMHAS